MNAKKIFACLLAAVMLLSAVACTGGSNPADTAPTGTDGSTHTSASDTTDAPETEGETVYARGF